MNGLGLTLIPMYIYFVYRMIQCSNVVTIVHVTSCVDNSGYLI